MHAGKLAIRHVNIITTVSTKALHVSILCVVPPIYTYHTSLQILCCNVCVSIIGSYRIF